MANPAAPTATGQRIRVVGALSGTVFVPSLESSVGELKAEVARLAGLESGVKLIVGGRTLQDDAKPLHAAGVSATSRVLVVAGAQAGTEVQRQEARAARLDRIRRVVRSMASRDALKDDAYALVLENQHGHQVTLAEEDRKALVMGLALHDLGRAASAKGDLDGALSLLLMAEESMSLVRSDILASSDNMGLLLLDIVWCCFKAGDIRRLAVARDRLGKARAALEGAYGPGLIRLRQLHGSACPERAIYARLELLEGVAAYHRGDILEAQASLRSAQARWQALQVPDSVLAAVQSMGFEPDEARRALRLSDGDIDAALTHIAAQRALQENKRVRQKKEAAYRKERRRYGRTPEGQYVDGDSLDRAEGLGYARDLAALALRLHGNNLDAALEDLMDGTAREVLVQLLSLLAARSGDGSGHGSGPSTSNAPPRPRPAASLLTAKAATTLAATLAAARAMKCDPDSEEVTLQLHACVEGLVRQLHDQGRVGGSTTAAPAAEGEDDDHAAHASDAEVEAQLRGSIQSDALASYDLDVREEGEAIALYTALCGSAIPTAAS